MNTDPSTRPPVFYGFGFLHHGPRAAFHGLAARLDREQVIDITPRFLRRLPARLRAAAYWRWLRHNEWRLRPLFHERERRLIHYFFPENTMYHAADWKRSHLLCATCHQPITTFRQRAFEPFHRNLLRGLRACDALVVQCASEVEGYRNLLGTRRMEVIPLGVDATFFMPGEKAPGERPPNILTVGSWLRDYSAWAEAVRRVFAQRADARFTVIANPDTLARARQALGPTPGNVRWLTGISDEALRDEYRAARLLYLPLEDAVANDAILEALAAGLPIVTTALPATREYVPAEAGVFVPRGDADAGADAILRLLEDTSAATVRGQAARARAVERFDWASVAQQYRAFWRSLG